MLLKHGLNCYAIIHIILCDEHIKSFKGSLLLKVMSKNILFFLSNYGPGFANKIADINAKFNMPIPWTASFIHQNTTGKRFHLYYNLADILWNNCINTGQIYLSLMQVNCMYYLV